ncbi:hypothetical protein CAEBREN_21579 [Caenorhabditis brenneri]|uniref:Uncharacterized protein n=1 Tax=Caenorhabditis brenneri TaxID=135651 RepID=G0P416_CAEBE|nr:hypothetical protein CAEBREN_21579 [Caenorhabditis brenneri]
MIQNFTDYLDGAIDVAKGLCAIGAFIYPPAAPVLGVIAGVGVLVQLVIEMTKPDDKLVPVFNKMKELEKTIFEVQKKMRAHFKELRSFIAESEFAADIITEASVRMKLMRNCLKYPTREAVNSFSNANEKHSALKLVYMMISFLEQKSTNPLAMAMEADKSKSAATFHKWENIISDLFSQFLFIEGFASGLLKDKCSYDWDRIQDRSDEVFKAIHNWKRAYGLHTYWDDASEYLRKYAQNTTRLTNSEKADEIRQKLQSYATDDVFYVIVFNHSNNENHLYYKIKSENRDRLLHYTGARGTNFLIYRRSISDEIDISKLIQDVRTKMERFKTLRYDDTVPVPPEIKNEEFVSGAFSLLIGDLDEEIRWANCANLEQGPGWISDSFWFGGTCNRRLLIAPY